MKILCVEEGSVDLQDLEENGLQDGKVLVFRQGSHPPFVLEIEKRKTGIKQSKWEELKEFVKSDTTSYFAKDVLVKMMELEEGE